MADYTLEERIAYASSKRDAAQLAIDAAEAVKERAREMSGGLLSFGGSGPQRARQQVQAASERGFRAYSEAQERYDYWDAKIRGYEARIAERDRKRLTRDGVAGATHVLLSHGWRKVAKVNKTTVSVETGYSWTDRYTFDKVLAVRTVSTSHSVGTALPE
jgi:hypothetical protein